MQTLRHEGDRAKTLFTHLVPFSRQSQENTLSDTQVYVDGVWHSIEVKECHSNTINQVRAIKYLPLVIFDGQMWYVIPPHEVVRLVSSKSRGQHTEIPFECANLTLSQLPSFLCCQSEQLPERVTWAIQEGLRFHEVKDAMDNLLTDLINLKDKTKSSITAILERYS
jgi:hypothetical protein